MVPTVEPPLPEMLYGPFDPWGRPKFLVPRF